MSADMLRTVADEIRAEWSDPMGSAWHREQRFHLAVADLLDAAYADWLRAEHSLGAISVRSMSGGTNEPDPHALAVARAWRGDA